MPRDISDEWLKNNDEQYRRRHKLRFPYYSERQMDELSRKEIPISNLDVTYIKEKLRLSDDEIYFIKDYTN